MRETQQDIMKIDSLEEKIRSVRVVFNCHKKLSILQYVIFNFSVVVGKFTYSTLKGRTRTVIVR